MMCNSGLDTSYDVENCVISKNINVRRRKLSHIPHADLFLSLCLYSSKTEASQFEPRYGQEFSLLNVVQTGSGAHRASYPMGTGGSFPRG
jgi:hypothetical protein